MPPLRFATEADAVTYIFRSMRKLRGQTRPPDDSGRDPSPTRRLIQEMDLLATPRQYTVVTGSKGKGSTTMITTRLLRALGYRTGSITSPHLVSWRERIRVDGQAIPESDFLRILDSLAPAIDAIETTLSDDTYFSPTGIFLAIALCWFAEQSVEVAVLEVGRGGRFDDIALVPNHIALFSPISLEHTYWLGPSLERIAWHKAGIIKAGGHALTVPQRPAVMAVLEAECQSQRATLDTVPPAEILGPVENGWRLTVAGLGEMTLPLLGAYQAVNAGLALAAAAAIHKPDGGIARLTGQEITHLREGMAQVRWPGRLQHLQDSPAIYLDGAVNRESAQSVVDSLRQRWTPPLVSVIAVPEDKDYPGVYGVLGRVSHALILTETDRNPILSFPDREKALALARSQHDRVYYADSLAPALDQARALAGTDGTILIVGTQSIVADTILLWGETYESL